MIMAAHASHYVAVVLSIFERHSHTYHCTELNQTFPRVTQWGVFKNGWEKNGVLFPWNVGSQNCLLLAIFTTTSKRYKSTEI